MTSNELIDSNKIAEIIIKNNYNIENMCPLPDTITEMENINPSKDKKNKYINSKINTNN